MGYEAHIAMLNLPDANDRHVLAAAIAAKASVIVTFNLKDFPSAILKPYGVLPVHPDAFLCGLFDAAPGAFLRALHRHRVSLKSPAKTALKYLEGLRINGLKNLALHVETWQDMI